MLCENISHAEDRGTAWVEMVRRLCNPRKSVENEAIHTVPLLNDIESFLDFLPESWVAEKFAQEDRLDDPAQLVESLIRGVLQITACKPAQQCIGIRRSRF